MWQALHWMFPRFKQLKFFEQPYKGWYYWRWQTESWKVSGIFPKFRNLVNKFEFWQPDTEPALNNAIILILQVGAICINQDMLHCASLRKEGREGRRKQGEQREKRERKEGWERGLEFQCLKKIVFISCSHKICHNPPPTTTTTQSW